MEKLYTAPELASILHLNKQTILRFIREGKLKSIKSGRQYLVKESELEEYIHNNTMVSVNLDEDTPILNETLDGAGKTELSTVDTEISSGI